MPFSMCGSCRAGRFLNSVRLKPAVGEGHVAVGGAAELIKTEMGFVETGERRRLRAQQSQIADARHYPCLRFLAATGAGRVAFVSGSKFCPFHCRRATPGLGPQDKWHARAMVNEGRRPEMIFAHNA
jgi:hypothetical protein